MYSKMPTEFFSGSGWPTIGGFVGQFACSRAGVAPENRDVESEVEEV